MHPMCALAPARLTSIQVLLSAASTPWQVRVAGTEGGNAADYSEITLEGRKAGTQARDKRPWIPQDPEEPLWTRRR